MEENIAESNETTPVTEDVSELKALKRKMHFTGTVINTSLAGAFVDIGVGVPGVVHISQLQEEPVNRVEDVVKPGDEVDVWVRNVVPSKQRIDLTMIKPLDLEWRDIHADMVLTGKVTRLEKFGVFVDIGAERPGLVHISEITQGYIRSPEDVVSEGEEVQVKVLSVNRRRKQIKLSMKAAQPLPEAKPKVEEVKEQAAEEEDPPEEPIPTAMEMAFREAMERTNNAPENPPAQKTKPASKDQSNDDILSRTLNQRVKSTS